MNPALQIAIGVCALLPMASQALAEDAYRCSFTTECLTDQPCREYEPREMVLARNDADSGLWSLTMAGQQAIPFTRLMFESEQLHTFVSVEMDRDGPAVAMMSVFSDGQAILGIQGVFMSPGSVTHLGTCQQENN